MGLRPLQLPVQLTNLVVQRTSFSAQRLDRVLLLLRSLQCLAQPGALPGQQCLCRPRRLPLRRGLLAQLGDLHAQRLDRVVLIPGPLQGPVQSKGIPRLRLAPALASSRLAQSSTEPTDIVEQLLYARFGRAGPRPFPLRAGVLLLVQRPQVARLARQRRPGGRPNLVVPLGQRRGCPKILVANRHALDDSGCRAVLPESRACCQ